VNNVTPKWNKNATSFPIARLGYRHSQNARKFADSKKDVLACDSKYDIRFS
jgi:hypothetical protein